MQAQHIKEEFLLFYAFESLTITELCCSVFLFVNKIAGCSAREHFPIIVYEKKTSELIFEKHIFTMFSQKLVLLLQNMQKCFKDHKNRERNQGHSW